MIFNYIKFTNFRPFYGEQTILFQNKDEDTNNVHRKNIVLIGGLNGHGKASLINSIYIALFGHRYFKTQNEYYNYISKSVNRKHVSEGGTEGSIELAFTDDSGKYAIQVDILHNRQEEYRMAYELDDNLNKVRKISMSPEEFNDFIDSRIPIDVAQFFIFDAEKIRDLVGEQDNEDTRKAIQKVVSLELYNQLLIDLDKLYNDFSREVKGKTSNKDINIMSNRIEEITEELEKLEKESKELQSTIDELNDDQGKTTRERRKLLANTSSTKSQISKWIGIQEQKVNSLTEDLNRFKKEQLYQIIIQPSIKSLQKHIREEQDYIEAKQKEQIKFAPYEEYMSELLNTEINPNLTSEQKEQLLDSGKEIWAKINKIRRTVVSEKIEILHDLSRGEFQQIMNYPTIRPADLKQILTEKSNAEELLRKYNEQLNDAPDEVNTSDYDKKIKELNQKLGELRAKQRNTNSQMVSLRSQKFRLAGDYKEKLKDIDKIGPLQRKIDLLDRLYKATDEFIDEVTVLKARQLKVEIEKILNQLFRKTEFEKIEFDEKTFSLTIINQYGDKVDLQSRSEGEKQLIALSMIWALTKVSGSNFPFVIDTPLARLDSIHRSNLVNHYFTKLSDQVIILSTDTEITNDFYQELVPFIETEYILNFDSDENYTTIEKGYFFAKEAATWRS